MIRMHTNMSEVFFELAKRAEALKPGGAAYDAILREAATTQLAVCGNRIHKDGKASDGSDIGQYSTKPMYANADNTPGVKFQPVGKTGRKVFESTGQPHKDKYFEGGYKELRDEVGRPSDKVNLSFSGGLQNQLEVVPTAKGYGLGWSNLQMLEIALGHEARYRKKIWTPTAEEKSDIIMIVQNGVNNALSGGNN